jgi:hypothetical protein
MKKYTYNSLYLLLQNDRWVNFYAAHNFCNQVCYSLYLSCFYSWREREVESRGDRKEGEGEEREGGLGKGLLTPFIFRFLEEEVFFTLWKGFFSCVLSVKGLSSKYLQPRSSSRMESYLHLRDFWRGI